MFLLVDLPDIRQVCYKKCNIASFLIIMSFFESQPAFLDLKIFLTIFYHYSMLENLLRKASDICQYGFMRYIVLWECFYQSNVLFHSRHSLLLERVIAVHTMPLCSNVLATKPGFLCIIYLLQSVVIKDKSCQLDVSGLLPFYKTVKYVC